MVSVAAICAAMVLDMDGSKIRPGAANHPLWCPGQRRAQAACGAVRTRGRGEAILVGQRADEATFKRAAEAALRDARPLAHNAHKVELGRRSVVRALMRASRLA
jgi:xanthine dehydrogenase iron-sulfur cluster and FAD-binding subunit A